MVTAKEILDFCKLQYRTGVSEIPGAVNIFYLEGCTASDLTLNPDLPDLWNDTRIVITYNAAGVPEIVLQETATSEPGTSATMSARARAMGGVFRISIGFHKECWQRGFHKSNKEHPALVQCAPITGHRDKNMDGKRTGDLIINDVKGLNQHGTRPGLKSVRVGEWSYACLVGWWWSRHITFIMLCEADPRYVADKKFKYSTTVVDWSAFWKWKQTV